MSVLSKLLSDFDDINYQIDSKSSTKCYLITNRKLANKELLLIENSGVVKSIR